MFCICFVFVFRFFSTNVQYGDTFTTLCYFNTYPKVETETSAFGSPVCSSIHMEVVYIFIHYEHNNRFFCSIFFYLCDAVILVKNMENVYKICAMYTFICICIYFISINIHVLIRLTDKLSFETLVRNILFSTLRLKWFLNKISLSLFVIGGFIYF